MNFGENLKTLRKKSKISQEVLAEKIGVTRQSVSKWEVGDAYPEMNNIIALCSIFHCNINDLINDNTTDIDSFDQETKDGIVKFKKNQQKRMKGISKAIYYISSCLKLLLFIYALSITFCAISFPFVAKSFKIDDKKISILNKEYDYIVSKNSININNKDYYIETSSDVQKFIDSHSNNFFRISIEYVLICLSISVILTVLSFHYLSKLFKNISKESTPFTLENERYVIKAIMFIFLSGILDKVTALIYMAVARIDLSIELNVKDLLILLIGVGIVYIFKYGRLLQVDSKAKIYD